jgi:leucyl/phenylalanyl-tRNA---protein transferase
MPVYALDDSFNFPPVDMADDDGLLAWGGDLHTNRLLVAYSRGIFPWYNEPPILWWCPDPRFVLFPEELIISSSMKKILRKKTFTFSINKDFKSVIHHCKTTYRPPQDGTWITDEMEAAFIKLHEAGFAHSAEAWQNNKLVGGMYGIKLGDVFFGESMFSTVNNASKFAFINFIKYMQQNGMQLLDCQVYSPHLESLGARMISRKEFVQLLKLESVPSK